ncbi:protein of unknown function DUF1995-containing protein [[Leptolyngbya] sp. PCC 7376]|uniref:DUF1995 family protein n=1 Tax=[Leptolyngbya] sp. PCC 7376 TaxID=111781 RepID=UPI00029ECD7A|nr:DUF1995 family protein [[Leptolyngbya] sp. PCC 7376]AFY38739.1 protein of unknown function DUF1995-containing protein [[Leptolyngbya] sp. PCC 7376]
MSNLPKSFPDTLEQAKSATLTSLEAGCGRVLVELCFPEIALKAQSLAWDFAQVFVKEYGSGLKVLFPDTGAAALAKRDWGEVEFSVTDIGSSRNPVQYKVNDADQIFLVVCPSSVEVAQVEKLCELAGDRPVIMLIPQLEDVSIVGIGYAARQLRERFISTLESAYYIRPYDGAMVWRSFPSGWEVYLEKEEGEYELIATETQKPLGEYLERLLLAAVEPEDGEDAGETTTKIKKRGIFGELQSFLKALSN